MNIQDILEEIHARYTMLLGETRNYMTGEVITPEEYDKVGLFSQVINDLNAEFESLKGVSPKVIKKLREDFIDPLYNIKADTKIIHIERFLVDSIRELNSKIGITNSPQDETNEDDLQAFHDAFQYEFRKFPTKNYELLKSIYDNKVNKSNYVYLRREYIQKIKAEHGNAADVEDIIIADFEDLWNSDFVHKAKKDVLQQAMQQREKIKNLVESRRARIVSVFCRI
jgi:hypothetical protein